MAAPALPAEGARHIRYFDRAARADRERLEEDEGAPTQQLRIAFFIDVIAPDAVDAFIGFWDDTKPDGPWFLPETEAAARQDIVFVDVPEEEVQHSRTWRPHKARALERKRRAAITLEHAFYIVPDRELFIARHACKCIFPEDYVDTCTFREMGDNICCDGDGFLLTIKGPAVLSAAERDVLVAGKEAKFSVWYATQVPPDLVGAHFDHHASLFRRWLRCAVVEKHVERVEAVSYKPEWDLSGHELRTFISLKCEVIGRHDLATQWAEFSDDLCFLEDENDDPIGDGEGDTFFDSDGEFDFDEHLRQEEESVLFGEHYYD